MKVLIILGTRPEIIKMSPIIRELEKLGLKFSVLHTGQHYTYAMDKVFLEQLALPSAKYRLRVGSGTHGEQTGKMLIGIEKALQKEKPDVVLVEGDTNTTLAGALAATKLGVQVGHVEAGLRSYDREMPEETNRVLTDHCSDLLFAPTAESLQNLLGEGIPGAKIFVTGNTIVDAVHWNLEVSKEKGTALLDLGLAKQGFFLATIHRQENVDNEQRFRGILKGLGMVREKFGFEVVYPIHPRARKQMRAFNLKPEGLRLLEPLDYWGFLQLECNARLVLTDSGGVQEETCVLKVPCVTLRNNTERQETLEVGSNVLAGTKPDEIIEKTELMLRTEREWANPFGDGTAGEKIVKILVGKLGEAPICGS